MLQIRNVSCGLCLSSAGPTTLGTRLSSAGLIGSTGMKVAGGDTGDTKNGGGAPADQCDSSPTNVPGSCGAFFTTGTIACP
jgi:hypothetical protein